MKNRARILIILGVVFGTFYISKKFYLNYQTSRFVENLKTASNRAASKPTDSNPLVEGTKSRTQLFEVRSAYEQIQLVNPNETTLKNLLILANGLASENEIVRETTGDIVRHVLTEYLINGGTHSPIVDEFFRIYKKSGNRSLAEFLTTFPDGREAQYLGAI